MSEDRNDPMARRDEVLEVLYWLEGEGIPGAATVVGMARFLVRPAEEVREVLEHLVARGDVEPSADSEFRLTPTGKHEAGRRFAEQYAGTTGQGEMVQHYAQMVDDDILQAHKVHSLVDNLSRLKEGR